MVDKINPYIAGAPVVEKRMFFGRQDVYSWIEGSLSGKYVDHILVLHGQRRVGKTSVLKHLSDRLPDRYIPIFIDLQGRVSTTLERFLWWLAREISRALKQIDLPAPVADRDFFKDPDYFESIYLPQIEQSLGEKRLLLTFDEFDSLETTAAQDGLALPFMAILKRLMDHKQINFIFSIGSSGHKLENMQAAYTGFFKQALYKKISFLENDDAEKLIVKPVADVLEFSTPAVEKIIEVTSGHPYFVQLVCHELFSSSQKEDRWRVESADVTAILPAVIERGTVNLKFVWDEANTLEKWLLAALAHHDDLTTTARVEEYLKQQKVRFVHQDLEAALLHLREKDVLTSENQFVIHLLRLWLIQNRPMEQVREELAATNPIVSRLLEIGQEYLDSGQYQRARQSFNEALEHDQDHLESLLGLAETSQRMGDYGQAAIGFERVLDLYADDVSAQMGYCNAYLALGDYHRTLGEIDEADYAYQQVLKINPEHREGLARMAGVHHHRAVKAIIGGEQVSLQELEKALAYSPEDSLLQSSIAGLKDLAENRVDRQDVLLSWGRLAQQAEFLDEALDLFGAYLRAGGDEDEIGDLIAELQSLNAKRKSAVLKARGEQMEKLGHVDQAMKAWREYLVLNPGKKAEVTSIIKQLEYQISDGLSQAPAPFWRRSWVWIALVIVLTTAALFAMPGSPLRMAHVEATLPVVVPTNTLVLASPTSASTSTPTTMPTPAPTAIPLRWNRVNSGLFLQRDTVTGIEVDHQDQDVIYASTLNGGVYKTIDGGITWRPVSFGSMSANISDMVMNFEDSETVLVAASDMVYKTTNGGETWEEASKGLNFPDWLVEGQLGTDPFNADTYYFSANFVFDKTIDGGEYWKVLTRQSDGCPDSVDAFAIDPVKPGRIYIAESWNGNCDAGVYVSEDDGSSWELIHQISDDVYLWGGRLLGNTSGDIGQLYFAKNTGLFRSEDHGFTWEAIFNQDCSPLAVDPRNSEVIYCQRGYQIEQTLNDGRSWEVMVELSDRVSAFTISPHHSANLFAGSSGIVSSTDQGKTWEALNNGLGANKYELVFDPAAPETVFIYESVDKDSPDRISRLFKSEDGGRTWNLISDQGFGFWMDVNGEVLYRYRNHDNFSVMILTSFDGGNTWHTQQMNIAFFSQLAVHPSISGLLFAYGADYRENAVLPTDSSPKILYSEDYGVSWNEASGVSALPHYYVQGSRIFFDSNEGNHAYLIDQTGPSGVYSTDQGRSWKLCTQYTGKGQPSNSDSRLAIHPADSEKLYVATRGGGVLISESGCRTWTMKPSMIGNKYVNTVAINPDDPDIVYAGTDGGVYISYDAGENWGVVNDGLLGSVTIFSIVIDPHDHTNILAATPYGIFKLETP
jgi:photosystem II stability/assembly factor-like uncharacterized protein/AAA+ ATPase superfamily predicted ATPase